MNDPRYLDRRDDAEIAIQGDRWRAEAYIVVSRTTHGVRHSVGLRAADLEQIIKAFRLAAKDAQYDEREDARRAQQMLGVARRGR